MGRSNEHGPLVSLLFLFRQSSHFASLLIVILLSFTRIFGQIPWILEYFDLLPMPTIVERVFRSAHARVEMRMKKEIPTLDMFHYLVSHFDDPPTRVPF